MTARSRPDWPALLPALLELHRSGTEQDRQYAFDRLREMADAASRSRKPPAQTLRQLTEGTPHGKAS